MCTNDNYIKIIEISGYTHWIIIFPDLGLLANQIGYLVLCSLWRSANLAVYLPASKTEEIASVITLQSC